MFSKYFNKISSKYINEKKIISLILRKLINKINLTPQNL